MSRSLFGTLLSPEKCKKLDFWFAGRAWFDSGCKFMRQFTVLSDVSHSSYVKVDLGF